MPKTSTPPLPLQLNERDAAQRLGLCVRTLQSHRQAGRIAFVKIGKRILYRLEALDDFSKRHEVPPAN